MSVKRVYVEKKPAYAVAAAKLAGDIRDYLNIAGVTGVRVLQRYDVENLSDETFEAAKVTVFSEPPVDFLYEETFEKAEDDAVFSVEYLPGQFDQRADSAVQCVKLLNENEEPIIHSAQTYVISGGISEEEREKIIAFVINPVDSRVAAEEIPETLVEVFDEPDDVEVLEGFISEDEETLRARYGSYGLAMTFADFRFIQDHFRDEEKRDPSMTEIRVLDTYWSDHCRHTTFQTELKHVEIADGDYAAPLRASWEKYEADHEALFAGRDDKYICLMDLALIAMRKLKRDGILVDQEETDEINACSIVVPIEVTDADGKKTTEEWLINFKNETHNHPTEIEPFGGAATCLGGAIRDPLSGRTYVYQAMRITGAADPTVPLSETMEGKLPQKKLVQDAAAGYSSYGNQIGLATGYVKEIYHPNYAAKRMEIGAVMGAAPRRMVMRETSDPGNVIVLLGGRTGRDGIGGATGSSKKHETASLTTCGAEVQKGNPPTERKLQRLFRREEVSRLIRKCNDFGAGGVSVAIGELADGLDIDLDKVPKKYAGLDGTEIAISESQERMAVVVAADDLEQFLAYAAEENLEATPVAVVTESPRLVMHWRGKTIVDLSRAFLDTNGARQEADVRVISPKKAEDPFTKAEPVEDFEKKWIETAGDLNVCSQKGLVERFDSSIGAASVLMPYGGKYQMTETQVMVAKVPTLGVTTDAVTMMSYGFDPYLSSWSPYHAAAWAVTDSVAKIVAGGGETKKIHFTFQEYFEKLGTDPERWGLPFAALLGANEAQQGFELASIGGKDSMSGSFEDMDVPPTLVSFAVAVADGNRIVSPEFKHAGDRLVLLPAARDENDMPDYENIKKMYDALEKDIAGGRVAAAFVLQRHGVAEAVSKMAFGNRIGAKLEGLSAEEVFAPGWGSILIEVKHGKTAVSEAFGRPVGRTCSEPVFVFGDVNIALASVEKAWNAPLEKIFRTDSGIAKAPVGEDTICESGQVYICREKIAKPTVFIPTFPGTNCEYDSARAFEEAGANVIVKLLRNRNADDIRESVEEFEKAIAQSQIIMFPGGFSGGDEPEGSAKFFATAFRNEKLKEAVLNLLEERDGLALGICNGFQALIKLGLLPHGDIQPQTEDSPTLTYNTIGRHISKMVYTKIVSDKSPWLSGVKPGEVFVTPVSHGEGRFVAPQEWIDKLFAEGLVATRYVTPEGEPTMDEYWNPNGSYAAIEGILSPNGRVFGKMAHIERKGHLVASNIIGEQDMKVFESGVKYFK